MKIGYGRVSIRDQNPHAQRVALAASGGGLDSVLFAAETMMKNARCELDDIQGAAARIAPAIRALEEAFREILAVLLKIGEQRQVIRFTQEERVAAWARERLTGPAHALRTLSPVPAS